MELMVDGKNVLEPVNLDENKEEIMRQRQSVPSWQELTYFKENTGLLDLFDAYVKGKDLNDLVETLQSVFSTIYAREINMYDQLDIVFQTVEAIHKGSIEGIIHAIQAAQKAIADAEYAIETIQGTLTILQEFKDQLEENTEHLNDIDILWDTAQQLDSDIKEVKASLSEKTQEINANSKVLMELKTRLDKIKHINDIDEMYKDLYDICRTFERENKGIKDRINGIAEEIQQLEKFQKSIEKIKHLNDVDTIFTELKELQGDVEENKESLKTDISAIQAKVEGLEGFRKELEKTEHLRDVDAIWEENNNLTQSVDKLNNFAEISSQKMHAAEEDIRHNTDEIDSIKNELIGYEVLGKEVLQLKGKVKILYGALGGTIGVVILQMILNMMGIM